MRYVRLTLILAATLTFAGGVLAADKYVVDPVHTSVTFSVKHMVISSVRGKFTKFSGTFMYDEDDVTRSSVSGSIETASIDTGNEKRDQHLKSEEFFHVDKFPEITFESKRIEKRGDSYVCVGTLTMHGVSKQTEVPFVILGKVKDPWGKTRIGIKASVTINRQDFGVSWSKVLEGGGLIVGNEVKVELDVEAIKVDEEKAQEVEK